MQSVNIYLISRVHDGETFNVVDMNHSQKEFLPKSKNHEVESLRLVADQLMECEVNLSDMDGFYWGFNIPQISKEFDLLKITEHSCLNIELKSQAIPDERILAQLQKNKHYLRHLGREVVLYTVVTDSMTCYQLTESNELVQIPFADVVETIKVIGISDCKTIEDLFRPSNYLVSPLNTPEKFINGEYFLTQNQEEIKRKVLKEVSEAVFGTYLHITGTPGTGKTLLLYDIAKELAQKGKTIIIHCGKLTNGQGKISSDIKNLAIRQPSYLRKGAEALEGYEYILVDETHRIYQQQFDAICEDVKINDKVCIFSTDPKQTLSASERRRNIFEKIKELPFVEEYVLSEKIRMNKELHSFILNVLDLGHKPKQPVHYSHVRLNYANTTSEAQDIISYYRERGYIFINFSKSNHVYSPYSQYKEDYDTHHVIGQEFDGVVILLDKSFYYDRDGVLRGRDHPNPDYLYERLFYQGITRARENLAIVVVDAPVLFEKMTSIIKSSN